MQTCLINLPFYYLHRLELQHSISASTIHSKLRIPIKDFSELEGIRLTHFQEEMSHVKYILIDEMSFIGEKLLENIDYRIRQAFPRNRNLNFGGKCTIVVHYY